MARAGRSLVVVLSAMRSLLNSEGGGPDGGACALVAACPHPGSGHPPSERYQLGGGGGASAARVALASAAPCAIVPPPTATGCRAGPGALPGARARRRSSRKPKTTSARNESAVGELGGSKGWRAEACVCSRSWLKAHRASEKSQNVSSTMKPTSPRKRSALSKTRKRKSISAAEITTPSVASTPHATPGST